MTPAERNWQVLSSYYALVKLVRFTYEYSSNQISHDNFLHAFFEVLKLPISNHITSFSHDHAFSEMERLASLRGACLLRDRYRHTIASTTIS
uniref:Uncharacterized protein n=1 Tax=Gibberella zeae TaxID=5518 RepID=A0A4E9DBT6_GIBZA